MVIDFHVHCFPDELAMKAVPKLAACARIPARLDGTLGSIKKSMRTEGISHSVILSIATKPSQTRTVNDWAVEVQDGEIICFGSIHPEYIGWKDELKRIKALGLKGIKLHPDYQDFFVDEQRLFPIYECAFDLGLMILFHAGVDIGLPEPYHCTPQRMRKVVRAFPGGKIIAAHMGGFKCWDEVEKYLVGEDIYFDTSYSLEWLGEEQFKRMVRNHGHKKIVFATDSPWTDQGEEIRRIKMMGFEPAVEEDILGNNAADLICL
ncbi:MAG: amidohydrolase family protein [Clostridia bacterium]|nr:amidohydrolase family protein [Clostridia bacterium]